MINYGLSFYIINIKSIFSKLQFLYLMYITSAHSIHLSALKECTHLGEKKKKFFCKFNI